MGGAFRVFVPQGGDTDLPGSVRELVIFFRQSSSYLPVSECFTWHSLCDWNLH